MAGEALPSIVGWQKLYCAARPTKQVVLRRTKVRDRVGDAVMTGGMLRASVPTSPPSLDLALAAGAMRSRPSRRFQRRWQRWRVT